MTHILNGNSALAEGALLKAMFLERKSVFVDLLGWDVPVLDGRFEIDQFDGPSTRYIIIAGLDGEHRGSMRLLPTDGPNILGSIFPDLCDEAPPSSRCIWEISRFCLSRSLRARERRIVRDQLVTAAVLFALQNDITAYTCVADMGWLSQILAFGWRCEPLGLPRPLDCGFTGAMMIHVTPQTPDLMQAAGTWSPSDMMRASQIAA